MKKTVGEMVDELTISNIRIWMLEDIKRNPNATNDEIAEATKKTNVENVKRNLLIQGIDEALGQTSFGKGTNKIYGK